MLVVAAFTAVVSILDVRRVLFKAKSMTHTHVHHLISITGSAFYFVSLTKY